MKPANDGLIRLIAIFKFVKATLLIALGVGAFKLLHRDLASVLSHGIEALKLDPGQHFLDMALAKAANVSPEQIKKVGVGSFVYAGLFLTEGTGLWLRKRWAEWLTVIITGSLIPLELYESLRHLTMIKVVGTILNIAIVVYLIYHIRARRSEEGNSHE